jgi:Fe-S-cluster containining protein
MTTTKKTYKEIFNVFVSPITLYDCGKKCAPKDGSGPVCCSTSNAVPIAQKSEWKVLKKAGDLWRKFKPYDDATQAIVDDLHEDCVAIECKGARQCDRDQRSLACRAFPFFPYITKEREFIGLAPYWTFEDRCWLISNTKLVEQTFIDEFARTYEILFRDDADEFELYRDYSATMRRVFSRKGRAIPLITLDGSRKKILPHGKGIKRA